MFYLVGRWCAFASTAICFACKKSLLSICIIYKKYRVPYRISPYFTTATLLVHLCFLAGPPVTIVPVSQQGFRVTPVTNVRDSSRFKTFIAYSKNCQLYFDKSKYCSFKILHSYNTAHGKYCILRILLTKNTTYSEYCSPKILHSQNTAHRKY